MKKILVTGGCGFIGFHLVRALAGFDFKITALDSINSYYDQDLKYRRLEELGIRKTELSDNRMIKSALFPDVEFIKLDTADKRSLDNLFEEKKFDIICHLAAQAGVQYSLINPQAYIDSNITGFLNILESCRAYGPKKLVYASSSSVYGNNVKQPFSESDRTDSQVSMYAASKKCNELMAGVYDSLYRVKSIGLRFFTVYGPWGRPDMAYFKFVKKILNREPIEVYNNGIMKRDFTYIDDITEGIVRIIASFAGKEDEDGKSGIYNIGRGRPEGLLSFIEIIEKNLALKAIKKYLPFQIGDVEETFADVSRLGKEFGYKPQTNLEEGIKEFVKWYREYNSENSANS